MTGIFFAGLSKDTYCKQAGDTVGKPGTKLKYDMKCLIVLSSRLYGSLQMVVPISLQ